MLGSMLGACLFWEDDFVHLSQPPEWVAASVWGCSSSYTVHKEGLGRTLSQPKKTVPGRVSAVQLPVKSWFFPSDITLTHLILQSIWTVLNFIIHISTWPLLFYSKYLYLFFILLRYLLFNNYAVVTLSLNYIF